MNIADIDELLRQLERNVEEANRYAAQRLKAALEDHKATGSLQASIQVTLDGLEGIVETSHPAAAPLEFGTTRTAAHPFFRSTLAKEGSNIANILERGVSI